MNILHVISSFDPATGGPPRIALRLAAGAANLGHHVSVLSYDAPHATAAIQQERAEVPGANLIEVISIPPPNRFEQLFAREARKELDRVIPQFDLVHVHSLWNAISRHAFASAWKHRVPYVLLVNGMLDPWSLRQKKLKKQIALKMGLRKMLARAAYLQAGNAGEKACIQLLGLPTPIEIIPNGIDPREFDPLPAQGQFYAKRPELNGDPFIFFMSRLHHKKGLDYLAAAFKLIADRHPKVRVVVAGPDDGAREPFERHIRAAGLQNRVHVIGSIYGQERFHILRDCACFCLPSRQEGFSVAILEAMACQKPVIISTPCHFPEVAQVGAGEVVPLETSAIAAALDRVLSDPDLQKKMGEAGRELVYREFTWPKIAEQTIAAYQRALNPNTPRS